MVEEGVNIIDVGGQSTRPGARILSAGQELKRVLPVIRCAVNSSAWLVRAPLPGVLFKLHVELYMRS